MPARQQRQPTARVSCRTCGASWPDDGSTPVLRTCPACTATDPNAGGSPARPEAEDDALIDAATRSAPVPGAGPAGRSGGDRDARGSGRSPPG